MCFVGIFKFKYPCTHRAFDHIHLLLPNLLVFVATASGSNAILIQRITYDVAIVDPAMFFYGISAYNHFIAFPSVAFTVEVLHLGRVSTILTSWYVLSQALLSLDNVVKAFAVPEPPRRKTEIT